MTPLVAQTAWPRERVAAALSRNGVTDRPFEATVELGERLVDRTVAAIAERVERARLEEPPLGPAPFPNLTYDAEAEMDALPFLDPMAKYMAETGFGLFSFDAEGGHAQYEFDFTYAPALVVADRLSFFRLMVKQVAKQAGLLATFMPKPYTDAWSSGHHFNMSLEELETGRNIFRDVDDERGRGWSKAAFAFVAGIIRHARAIAAVATPTVNSYKRLTPRLAGGDVSWAPVLAAYGDNNRSCMLRLPRNRPAIENRAVDSAASTCLTAAIMLAAGMEGMRLGLDPGDPIDDLTYDWASGWTSAASAPTVPDGAVRLPRNLLEALDAFRDDPLVREVFRRSSSSPTPR